MKTKVRPVAQVKERDATNLAVSNLATIYGCCGLFDLCSDGDLMSLSFEGASKFLDWLGWERTDVCRIKKNFITWAGTTGTAEGNPAAGTVEGPCEDPNSVEYGVCDFTLEDFSLLRLGGPVRDRTKTHLRLCETQPRYRLDGSPITDDLEYDLRLITEVNMQTLKRMVITGSKLNPGQADGLEQLVRTGYTNAAGRRCTSMDSILVNWNSNDLDGGAGITWTDGGGQVAVDPTLGFVDVLLEVFATIRQRIELAPALAAQAYGEGDTILLGTTKFMRCLLDAFTCWSVCPGQQYREANLNTFDARQFRLSLNGGKFGDGEIYLDGFTVPLIRYDWGLIKGPTRSDAYLLTGNVGTVKTLQGQYNDMAPVAADDPARFDAFDGGRVLSWTVDDHTCSQRIAEMQTRMLAWAPFLQARFQNVVCRRPGRVISPDPNETSFRIEGSTSVEVCP